MIFIFRDAEIKTHSPLVPREKFNRPFVPERFTNLIVENDLMGRAE